MILFLTADVLILLQISCSNSIPHDYPHLYLLPSSGWDGIFLLNMSIKIPHRDEKSQSGHGFQELPPPFHCLLPKLSSIFFSFPFCPLLL
ncbi:unnamed protein product [Linum trigynum]|uniref:Secreted protein n=1 Tax=Linum trigynum TaxID=586398 RepID=A0AAV2GDF0_9ROSI